MTKPSIVWTVALWIGLLHKALPAANRPSSLPVLLVHGLIWNLQGEDYTWGDFAENHQGPCGWSGMIGFLESQGLSYGGAIRPTDGRSNLPEHLDLQGVQVDPRCAAVYSLKFSAAANTDGVAYKALELAEAIRQLCQFTGAKQVRIIAHSAGGLIARAYLQNALPGVEYRHDIDRLVTIGTPHLGSALAWRFGDLLGTRATSLAPDAPLVQDLDDKLDLPDDVTFASIVVRGLGADERGDGRRMDKLADQHFLARLPVEYRTGGDQVVHTKSQNLRAARCAARYEERTGRPIQYILVRVPDPSPALWPPNGFLLRKGRFCGLPWARG